MWTTYRPYTALVREMLAANRAKATNEAGGAAEELLPPAETDFDPTEDDAFSTLMQWLYWKIPAVKAQPPRRRL